MMLISNLSTTDQIMRVRIFAVHVRICVWVSNENEFVQDTGAHGNQDDGVGMQMHCRQEATEPLTQNSKGILHDTPGMRQLVAVNAFSQDLTKGGMVLSSRFEERKHHPLRNDRALAGHH